MDPVRGLYQLLDTKFPDKNYDTIGKKKGIWKKREFLAFDKEKNTWSIKELNVFQRFFRWFKRYRSTHLRCVLQQIDKEKDRLPLSFREKMVGLWRKAHPKDACPLKNTIVASTSQSRPQLEQSENLGGTQSGGTGEKPDETGNKKEEVQELIHKYRANQEDYTDDFFPSFLSLMNQRNGAEVTKEILLAIKPNDWKKFVDNVIRNEKYLWTRGDLWVQGIRCSFLNNLQQLYKNKEIDALLPFFQNFFPAIKEKICFEKHIVDLLFEDLDTFLSLVHKIPQNNDKKQSLDALEECFRIVVLELPEQNSKKPCLLREIKSMQNSKKQFLLREIESMQIILDPCFWERQKGTEKGSKRGQA